jgi:hypothetical protein
VGVEGFVPPKGIDALVQVAELPFVDFDDDDDDDEQGDSPTAIQVLLKHRARGEKKSASVQKSAAQKKSASPKKSAEDRMTPDEGRGPLGVYMRRFKDLKAEDLKAVLKEAGLPTKGKKAEMKARLLRKGRAIIASAPDAEAAKAELQKMSPAAVGSG